MYITHVCIDMCVLVCLILQIPDCPNRGLLCGPRIIFLPQAPHDFKLNEGLQSRQSGCAALGGTSGPPQGIRQHRSKRFLNRRV